MTILVGIGLVLAGLMLGAAGLAYFYRRREARWPTSWEHVGTPPAGADVAIRLLEALAPGPVRSGGTVEWVEGPFTSFGVPVAGILIDSLPVRVRVTRWERVEQSALAHEVAHAWWEQLHERSGEGDADFVAWVARANRVIATALEGIR